MISSRTEVDAADAGRVTSVELRRDPTATAWWSLLGSALIAAGVFFVVDSDGHPVAWAALVIFVVVAAYFVSQLVAPTVTAVRLTHDELRARCFLRTVEVPWDDVRLARVGRRFGEPVLTLDLDPGAADRRVRLLLPVGCDLDRLHGFLSRRLGRADR